MQIYRFQQQDNVHEIYIYDEIKKTGPFNWETWQYEDSETSAKHFKELLDAIPETDEIKIYFNSNGGSVDQGTAIYNMLKQHGSYKTGIVMGVCHSIAFTILQACDKRIMGQGTTAIIHDMWETVTGNAADLRAEADNLDVAMESCIALFMQRAKISEDEVREMMHREVDYGIEAATTRRFAARLKDDPRYIVPEIVDEFCAKKVLCMTFERGVPVNSPVMLSLPQERRNKLGEASLEIAVRELFEWGEMQTDPNFGNYLVRLGNGDDVKDKIVLLDFGAIRQFDENLLTVARNLIHAGYNHNKDEMVKAMTGYEFFDAMPESIKPGMADVFLIATEAFSCPANNPDMPAGVMDEQDRYDWKKSQLHSRVMQQAAQSMASRYFSVPPKEFMFISRKFIGAYTFMTVIEAKTNVRKMIRQFA